MSIDSSDKIKKKTALNPKMKNVIIYVLVPIIVHTLLVTTACIAFYILDADIYGCFAIIGVILATAYFLSAYLVGMKIRKNGMIVGIIYNLIPTAIYLTVSLLLNVFKFDLRLLVVPSVYILFSAIGGITAVNSRTSKNRKR